MSFKLNTNIAATNAHIYNSRTNQELDKSLNRLSSGLKINSSADDSSGLTIADSLKSQSNALNQSIKNANDAIGILQTADMAIEEQVKIINTMKTKAIQAAQDGQSNASRKALQEDIRRLREEFDNIANTTSFNGMSLLSGSFTNKEFEIGAYSRETINVSIGSTDGSKLGTTSYKQSRLLPIDQANPFGDVGLTLKNYDGTHDMEFHGVPMGYHNGEGIGVLADLINSYSDVTNVRAAWVVEHKYSEPNEALIAGTTPNDFAINDIVIGSIPVDDYDRKGSLVWAINEVKLQTGVEAYTDVMGGLVLNSLDGRAIKIDSNDMNTLDAMRITHTAASANSLIPQAITSPAAQNAGAGIGYNNALNRYEIPFIDLSGKIFPIATNVPSTINRIELEFTNFDWPGEFIRFYKKSDFETAKLATGIANPTTIADYASISNWLDINAAKIVNIVANNSMPASHTQPDFGLLVDSVDPAYVSSHDISLLADVGVGTVAFDLNNTGEDLYIEARGAFLNLNNGYLYNTAPVQNPFSNLTQNYPEIYGPISVGKIKLIHTDFSREIETEGYGLEYIGMKEDDAPYKYVKGMDDMDVVVKDTY
ncbi:MAG TPA: hypothetical protein PLV58_08365, partial [Campylobacterales bacterium]|nr:hypothetical protein [Campylobacterales bacterium]